MPYLNDIEKIERGQSLPFLLLVLLDGLFELIGLVPLVGKVLDRLEVEERIDGALPLLVVRFVHLATVLGTPFGHSNSHAV